MSPNAMAYGLANDKANGAKVLPSKNGAHYPFDHQKGLASPATPYKMCGENGVHMFMNTQSMYTATNLQFVVPKSTKVALCNDITLPKMLSHNRVVKQTTAFVGHQTSLLTPVVQKFAYITNANGFGQETPQLVFAKKKTFLSPQSSVSVNDSKAKYDGNDHTMHPESSGDGNFVNTIKNFFTSFLNRSLIRPIIETTTKIVGTDNAKPSSPVPMSSAPMQWNETSTGSSSNNNHKTQPMYCDNRSSNSFCYTSEQSNIFVNFMPETYLDCDDYIDGGEDTVDFVADSTKIQWNSYGDDLVGGSSIHSSPSDNIYYDCFSKFESNLSTSTHDSESQRLVQPQHEPKQPVDLVEEHLVENTKLDVISNSPKSNGQIEHVQYGGEESTVNCPKLAQPNRNRRKRRGKRKHNASGNYRKKGNGTPKKNQHEKQRHEVEMNIHDDIDDCFIVNDGCHSYSYEPDDEDFELEIIDVDDEQPNCMASLNPPAGPSSKLNIDKNVRLIETPIPSPEKIPFGKMFTQFFRFDNGCNNRKLLPFRCAQKQVPHVKPVEERPTSYRRTSETESDDSFIVFEDNKRQRQLSECSDDFILFADDDADYCGKCDTTDEDFTDSTDDSDTDDGN